MKRLLALAALAAVLVTTGCAGGSAFGESLNRALNGVSATWVSYDQYGNPIDNVHGRSMRVSRDTRFDITDVDSNGNVTTTPGDVLLVSIGSDHLSHVGSSACIVQDGLTPVATGDAFDINSLAPGTPWLNDAFEKFRNRWQGKAKTILIRSQNGLPIAAYAGSEVEIFATDVPKSTWFRVDRMYLWCYRVDYTMVDTALIRGP